MTRRIVALAVCSALIISLGGCGDKDKKKDNSNTTAESSSIADNSSLADSSSSDSSATDKPAETSKTEVAQTTTTPSQTEKPVTNTTTPTITTTIIAAGCYQNELKGIKGWDNKYRPSGKYAYITYGTKSAQEYYEVVKTAYEIVNYSTVFKKIEEKTLNGINDLGINYYYGRTDNLIPKNDNNFIMFLVSSYYIDEKCAVSDGTIDLYNLGNAYNSVKNETSSFGDLWQFSLAICNQRKAQTIFSKVKGKDNKEEYFLKITDSLGKVWYRSTTDTFTEKELLDAQYKIIQSDYFD